MSYNQQRIRWEFNPDEFVTLGVDAKKKFKKVRSIRKKINIDFLLFFSCSTVVLGFSPLFSNNILNYFLIPCLFYGIGFLVSVAVVLVEGKKRFIRNINISVAIITAFSISQILGPYISGILIDLEKVLHLFFHTFL